MDAQPVIVLHDAVLDAHTAVLNSLLGGDPVAVLTASSRFIESVRALAEAVSA